MTAAESTHLRDLDMATSWEVMPRTTQLYKEQVTQEQSDPEQAQHLSFGCRPLLTASVRPETDVHMLVPVPATAIVWKPAHLWKVQTDGRTAQVHSNVQPQESIAQEHWIG